MALDLTLFDARIQAAITALAATPDMKALLLISKAIEATRPTAAVSDVLAASVSQQAIIVSARATAITAINAARDQALIDIQNAGQGSAAASGIAFTPVGGIAATNVQGALAEVDSEASKKGANLADLTDLAAARQNLALRPGFEVQPYDADLAAIAGLTSAADRLPYFTGPGAAGLATLTAFARSVLDDADAATMRATLLLGAAALLGAGTAAGQVPILDGNGKLVTTILPESVLGGVKYQSGWDASANSPALPAPSAANRGWYYIVTTAGTTSLTGPAGAITDWQVGDWAVSDGTYWEKVDSSDQVNSVAGLQGTITAANLRTALALVIGTNVQAWDADLDALAALTTQAYGRSLLTLASKAAVQTELGVPTKAAGTDLRTLADDAKFLTAKSMADAMAYTSPAWAATFIPDWGTNGFRQSIVATGNTTLGGPFVGGKDGEDVALEYGQDATGGRSLAVNTTYVKIPTGLTITASTAANKVDLLTGYLRMVAGTLVLQVTGFLQGAR